MEIIFDKNLPNWNDRAFPLPIENRVISGLIPSVSWRGELSVRNQPIQLQHGHPTFLLNVHDHNKLKNCDNINPVGAADLQAIATDHHKFRYSRISLENGGNTRLVTFWAADFSNQEPIERCRQTVCFSA